MTVEPEFLPTVSRDIIAEHDRIVAQAARAAALREVADLCDEWAGDDAPRWMDQVPYLVRTEVVSRLRAILTEATGASE